MSSEKPLKAPGSEKKAKKDKSKKRKLEVADDVAPEPIEESKPKKSKLKSKDNSMSDLNVSSEVVPAPGIDTGDKKSKDKSKKRKLDAAEEEASEFVKDPTPKRSKRKVEIVDEDVYFQEMREKRKRMQEKKDGLLAELEDVEDCVVEPPADDVVVGAESSKSIKREKKDKKDKKAKKTAEKSDDALASNEDEVSLQVLPKEEIEVAKSADSSKSRKKDKKGKKTAEGFIDALASNADEVTLVREKPKKEKKMKESSQVKDDAHEGESAPAVEEVAVDKKSKKDKKAKKTGGDDAVKINGVNAAEDVKSSEKKEKNEKMSKKAKGVVGDEKAIQQNDGADSAGDANVDEDAEVVEQPTSDKKGKKNGPKSRFIAFVGNLPYDVTKEELEEHFKKIPPADIRMMHSKETGKGKGFCFIEWATWDKLQTAFQLYHHTMFRPDAGKLARKINVEISAGGGGNKSETRKQRIKDKNDKLNEDRKRYAERKAEFEEASKKAKEEGHGDIHPSRMGMMIH